MTLRRELSLFFGGLLLVVLSLVVGLNYTGLRATLESGLRKQFSPQPFLSAAKSERQLLLERSRGLVSNQLINNYRRDVLSSLSSAENSAKALADGRADQGAAGKKLHAELTTLYDQALGVLSGTGTESASDLIVVTGDDGRVLLETLGVTYEGFADKPTLGVKAESLTELDLWEATLANGSARGYQVYPNGKLYLFGTSWFLKGEYFDGVALVGTAVDREFLAAIAGDSLVYVEYGDNVVGATEQAETLGKEIRGRSFTSGDSEVWQSVDGKSYLFKAESLKSFYTDPASVTESTPEPKTVGRIVFLRDLAEVRAAAFAQSRQTLVLGLAALAVALLLVPLLARRFTGPVGALSRAMLGVGEGTLEQIPEGEISSIREIENASRAFNQMVVGLRQKKALETFVPEGTRQEVEASGGATPELGGKRVERTILFSDLRGFTSMSERLSPTQVMEVLNLYLESMTRAIRLQGGDINEYIGDAILAVFETPDAAVRAARDMCRELTRLHASSDVEELQGLGQGIGLHTGPIVEGNIGEKNARLKRAVVGDTVNLAARIQDRSREGKFTCIFLSGDSKAKLSEEVPLEFFGDEQFKGKAELIPVWEVRDA